MKYLILLLLLAHTAYSQDSTQYVVPNRQNSDAAKQKPYVILISADGFRHDYAEKYQAEHLLQFSREGVKANSMLPVFPSLTFPNHYSIVTGLYPSHHGLVNNTFYDRNKQAVYAMSDKKAVWDSSWYGGTPLWVLAEQQQMLSASLFWVASEAAVKGVRPTYYHYYTEKITPATRIKTVKDWLALPGETRPHLITFYLPHADHAGHYHGVDDPLTAAAVATVDSIVYQLTEVVRESGLPVNFIFLSDHGMTNVDSVRIPISPAIDTAKFLITEVGTMLAIHAKNGQDIQPLYDALKKEEGRYKVYLRANVPKEFRYNKEDDRYNRIGDLLLFAQWPNVFSKKVKPNRGYHGYAPFEVKDMDAVFIAWGPAFKSNISIPSFENIHVYPLIAEILGLKITEDTDGRKEVLKDILK